MVWYFIAVYVINRTLHGRLEILNFTSQCSERVKYFSTLEEKLRISKRSYNILYILQFHRGRRPRRGKWVLGLFDTLYVPARPYLQLVRRRNAATLLGIIQRQVQPGSIVYTDQWAAYRQMQRRLGLNHRTVNHSLHFVDPITGVHTQHAESNWSAAKENVKDETTTTTILNVRRNVDSEKNSESQMGFEPTTLRDLGSNPIWDSEFFSESTFLLIFNIVVVVVSSLTYSLWRLVGCILICISVTA